MLIMFVEDNEMKNNNEIICVNERMKNNKQIIWKIRFNGGYLDAKIKIKIKIPYPLE